MLGYRPVTIDPISRWGHNIKLLASNIHLLIHHSAAVLSVDFPGVVERYSTMAKAERAVRAAVKATQESKLAYCAYTVSVIGRFAGMAWHFQDNDWNGPLIAAWLDPLRVGAERGVGLELLQEGAVVLGDSSDRVRGYPWTVVRTDHPVMPTLLSDPKNGFEGFVPVDDPCDYSGLVGDGVSVPRQKWVARRSIEELAVSRR